MIGEDHIASKAAETTTAEESAAEKPAAEESAEIDDTMEEIQLGAADDTHRNEGVTSPGTSASNPADGTKGSFVTKKTTITEKKTLTKKSGFTKKSTVRIKKVVSYRRS